MDGTMARMLSMQSQCCCCSASVFSALFGIIIAATGISLVLNYRITEVDTGGLPPELQNEEGKKVVGIILICCGFGSMGISAVIATVYFTICSRPKVTVTPVGQKATRRDTPPHLTGGSQSTSADPYSSEVTQSRHGAKGGSRHGKRQKKRTAHLKPYKSKLTPHQEVINESEARHVQLELNESPRSLDSSQTGSSKTNSSGVLETSLTGPGNPPVTIRIHEPSIGSNTVDTHSPEPASGIPGSGHVSVGGATPDSLRGANTPPPAEVGHPAVRADTTVPMFLESLQAEDEEV